MITLSSLRKDTINEPRRYGDFQQTTTSSPPSPVHSKTFISSHLFPSNEGASSQEDTRTGSWYSSHPISGSTSKQHGKNMDWNSLPNLASPTSFISNSMSPKTNQSSFYRDKDSIYLETSSPLNTSMSISPQRKMRLKDDQAPPIQSLYDLQSDNSLQESVDLSSPSFMGMPTEIRPKKLPTETTGIFPGSLDGKEPIERETSNGRWVTVFGFQPSRLDQILDQFQRYGNIVVYIAENGNWVHLQYETVLQAQKAQSKNGKLISEGMMIGVIPYRDQNQNLSLQKQFLSRRRSLPLQPIKYQPTESAFVVDQSSISTHIPQGTRSFFSMIAEYILGW